jgi:hypothetical protein
MANAIPEQIAGQKYISLKTFRKNGARVATRQAINRKYWAARIPLLWWKTDTYIELSF